MILFRVTGIDLLIAVFRKEKACRENRIILYKEHKEKIDGKRLYIKLLTERWRKPGLYLGTVLEASLWE